MGIVLPSVGKTVSGGKDWISDSRVMHLDHDDRAAIGEEKGPKDWEELGVPRRDGFHVSSVAGPQLDVRML